MARNGRFFPFCGQVHPRFKKAAAKPDPKRGIPLAKAELLPPLVLQPLLENAIYHGVEPGTGTGDVLVRIERREKRVLARIENPYHESASGHVGNRMALDNIRERLMLYFDAEARLESRIEGGRYRVEIEIPYRSEGGAAGGPRSEAAEAG